MVLDEHAGNQEPLLSFSRAQTKSNPFKKSNTDEEQHDVYELLNYYRSRCAEFDHERKEYIARFSALNVRLPSLWSKF